MCGVIGIYGHDEVITELYDGLLTVQHRGQDNAGMVTYNGKFNLHKGFGLVINIFTPEILQKMVGSIGIGHTRYPTVGAGDLDDAQPMVINAPYGISMVHNGNISNFLQLKKELKERHFRHIDSNCDIEAILNVFAKELMKEKNTHLKPEHIYKAVAGVYKQVFGSYSVVGIIAGKGLIGFRDPHGIRPLLFGKKKTEKGTDYIFASESVTLDVLGYELVRDVERGEVIFIDADRKVHTKIIEQKEFSPCIFEYIYFARPDTIINGISVYKARLRLGTNLAKEWKKTGKKPDVVIPVPDSSRSAALSMSEALGIPYREGLIKNRYIGRTFIMPNQEQRKRSIKHKLNPMPLEIKGKKVLLVDDSIVRGNTSKQIIQMVRDAGAKEVYYASSAPPIKHPCVYGIDMQTKSEFVAKDRTIEQIRKHIGADALIYQDMEGMINACSYGKVKKFCTACFNGKYPTPEVDEKMLDDIEKERLSSKKSC